MSKEKASVMAMTIMVEGKKKEKFKKQWMKMVEEDIKRRGL